MDRFRFETKDGRTVITPLPDKFSYFCKFDQLQGIIGNPKQVRVAKKDSCYLPAPQLIKRNSN